jgi:hypothetical protein
MNSKMEPRKENFKRCLKMRENSGSNMAELRMMLYLSGRENVEVISSCFRISANLLQVSFFFSESRTLNSSLAYRIEEVIKKLLF